MSTGANAKDLKQVLTLPQEFHFSNLSQGKILRFIREIFLNRQVLIHHHILFKSKKTGTVLGV